jgi:transcriptional regulator with XRE-family HTH domain
MPHTDGMQNALLNEHRLKLAIRDWARQCGKRLTARRIAVKWTQSQLASLADVNATAISKFELGLAVPKDSVRLAIACALMCEVVDIWPPMERNYAMNVARELAA